MFTRVQICSDASLSVSDVFLNCEKHQKWAKCGTTKVFIKSESVFQTSEESAVLHRDKMIFSKTGCRGFHE